MRHRNDKIRLTNNAGDDQETTELGLVNGRCSADKKTKVVDKGGEQQKKTTEKESKETRLLKGTKTENRQYKRGKKSL